MAERSPSPASPAASGGDVPRGYVRLSVVYLDGTKDTPAYDRKTKGTVIASDAHKKMATGEEDYFSLYYFINDIKIFINPLKSLKDTIRSWRSTHRGAPMEDFVLYYGVKFYVTDPAKLKEDHSRYLYCLQLCRDIRTNLVLIDRETATRLMALMLQATVGDYDEADPDHGPGYMEKFPDFLLLPTSIRPPDHEAQLIELHKSKAGYTPAQAETEFLQLACRLTRYGMHIFEAQDDHEQQVWVGNGALGITFFRKAQKEGQLTWQQIAQFKWQHIVKVSYKRRKFRIIFRPPQALEQRPQRVKLHCGPPPASKHIWKNAVEQHTFFRLAEPEQPTVIDILFRRGSKFRYSGRTLSQAQKARLAQEQPFRRTHSERLHRGRGSGTHSPLRQLSPIPYDIGKGKEEDWVILHGPPADEHVDRSKQEQQQVRVDFRSADGLPTDDTHKFVLRREEGGFKVQGAGPSEHQEPAYHLSVVDEESQLATLSVSLNIIPQDGATVSQRDGGKPIFDSERMPVVKLHHATAVTMGQVIQSDGTQLSSGSQHMLMNGSHDISGELDQLDMLMRSDTVQLVEDGSAEADQVRQFLEQEGTIFQKALDTEEGEGEGVKREVVTAIVETQEEAEEDEEPLPAPLAPLEVEISVG